MLNILSLLNADYVTFINIANFASLIQFFNYTHYIMKRNPLMYQTVERTQVLSLSTRADKLGNIVHCVEFVNSDNHKDYACFKKLSSAMDFISTNFM